jgi:hypothetical protein
MGNILVSSHSHSFTISITSVPNNLNTAKQYGLVAKIQYSAEGYQIPMQSSGEL